MKTVLVFVDFFLLMFVLNAVNGISVEDAVDEDDDESSSWSRCPFIRNQLKNGRVKLRSRGRIAKFMCDPGYELAGKRFTTCVRGQWNNPIPACVSRGCSRPPVVANARVSEMYRGAVLLYECLPGYTMHGGGTVYCDGRQWSSEAPVCGVSTTNPMKSCDFEDPNLCGWSHDPTHDFDWKRNQFATPSGHVGTGPTADHTFGPGKGGFYLYIEASSPRKVNDTARLFSPVYPSDYSDGCFAFWYHMFGSQTGGLRVYVKPESHVFAELLPTWTEYGDKGNQWLRGNVTIPHLNENFQIVIEGIRGSGYISDTAIDDVRLIMEDCSQIGDATVYTSEFSPTSCRGRCRETNDSYPCACNDECVMSGPGIPCCEDFLDLCTKRPDGTDNPEEYSATVSTYMPVKVATASETGFSTSIQTTTPKISTPGSHMPLPSVETVVTTTSILSETPVRSSTTVVPKKTTPTVSADTFSSSTTTTTPSTSSVLPTSTFSSIITSTTLPITISTISSTISIPKKVTFSIPFESLTTSGFTSSSFVTVPSTRSTVSSSSLSGKSTTPLGTTTKSLLSSTTPYTTSTIQTTPSIIYSMSTPISTPKTATSTTPSTTSRVVTSSPTSHLTTKSYPSSTISSRFRASSLTTQGSPSTTISSRFRASSSTTQGSPSTTISSRFRASSSTTEGFPSTTMSSRFRATSNRPSSTSKMPDTTKRTPLTSTILIAPLPTTTTPRISSPATYRTSTRTTTRFTTSSTTTIEETRRTYNLRPRVRTTPMPFPGTYHRSSTRRIYWFTTKPTMRTIYPQTTTIQPTTIKSTAPDLTTTEKVTFSSLSTANTAMIVTEETVDMSKRANHLTTASNNNISTVTIVSVLLMLAACVAGGLVFYIRRWKSRRQAKLVDDSEMRYLQQNESADYSDATALEKMNSNHHLI